MVSLIDSKRFLRYSSVIPKYYALSKHKSILLEYYKGSL